jgi:hypothetical protein
MSEHVRALQLKGFNQGKQVLREEPGVATLAWLRLPARPQPDMSPTCLYVRVCTHVDQGPMDRAPFGLQIG